jgi:PBP1b-binding outer membrane lipoprotein LpoB
MYRTKRAAVWLALAVLIAGCASTSAPNTRIDYDKAADFDDRAVNYQVGTINVDIVDAARKQLIWEGVAEGRVSEEALANPKVTINAVVTEMMRQYPGKPNM